MYNALIRTHHITSRKKVAALKAAAKRYECYALLRSGGVPGLMFVESEKEDNVKRWVDAVHALRYKDYQLIAPSAPARGTVLENNSSFEEVDTVKEFGAKMHARGVLSWWRRAMGFTQGDFLDP